MLPDGRRLGAHLPLAGGMVAAVERAHAIGADALQIWTDNPTAWRRRREPPAELAAFQARLSDHGIGPNAIHAAYLVNLAGPDPATFARSVEMLAHELRGAPMFRARFVNVHIGSHRGTTLDAGIQRLADGVAQVMGQVDGGQGAGPIAGPDAATLALENSVGSGWGIGTSVEELAAIADAIDARGIDRSRVGFCLDTAHAWGAGIDVGDPGAVDSLLSSFDERIGLDRLVMVHLNDSRAELGSRLDRHEHLGAGRIGQTGLAHLLRHPALAHATYFLETPGMDAGYDAVNMDRARALFAGEPLPELPPEAFELPSSRARTAPK